MLISYLLLAPIPNLVKASPDGRKVIVSDFACMCYGLYYETHLDDLAGEETTRFDPM